MTITREQVEAMELRLTSGSAYVTGRAVDEAVEMLHDLWQRVEQAEATLIDIARMGKKAGSESAKHRLREVGIEWETGEASPDYGSMT